MEIEFANLRSDIEKDLKDEFRFLKDQLTRSFEKEQLKLKEEINLLKSENQELKLQIKNNVHTNIKKAKVGVENISKAQDDLKKSFDVYQNNSTIITDKIKDFEKEIAQNQTKINEQLELGKKIEQSVNELWRLIDNNVTDDNPWLKVIEKGKTVELQLRNEQHEQAGYENESEKTKESFELVIFGDSITKYIRPEKICKCDTTQALNYSKSGAKVRGIYEQLNIFQEEHKDAHVKNILIHVGTNHLPRENPEDITRKICKLLMRIRQEYPDAIIFYSCILPKIGREHFNAINYINKSIYYNICIGDNHMCYIGHSSFARNGLLNEALFWKDKVHTNKKGLQQLAYDFINSVRNTKVF